MGPGETVKQPIVAEQTVYGWGLAWNLPGGAYLGQMGVWVERFRNVEPGSDDWECVIVEKAIRRVLKQTGGKDTVWFVWPTRKQALGARRIGLEALRVARERVKP